MYKSKLTHYLTLFTFTSLLVFTASFALALNDEGLAFEKDDAEEFVEVLGVEYSQILGDDRFMTYYNLQSGLKNFAKYDAKHDQREQAKLELADQRVAMLESFAEKASELELVGDLFKDCETHADKLAKMERFRAFFALSEDDMRQALYHS